MTAEVPGYDYLPGDKYVVARFDESAYLRQQLAGRDATIELLQAQVAVLRGLLAPGDTTAEWASTRPSCVSEFCTPSICNENQPGEHCAWAEKVDAALANHNPEAERLVKLARLVENEEWWDEAMHAVGEQLTAASMADCLLAAINEAVSKEGE